MSLALSDSVLDIIKRDKICWKETAYLYGLGITKIPMVAFTSPVIIGIEKDCLVLKIKDRRRTRNHLNSLYFGAQAVGADLACGLFAFFFMKQKGCSLKLAFKDFKADFHKMIFGDAYFVCQEAEKIESLISLVQNTKTRHTQTCDVFCYTQQVGWETPASSFSLGLSLGVFEKKSV